MNILALDIATKVGWAAREDGEFLSGVLDLSAHQDDARKGWEFYNWLTFMAGGMELVATEMPFGRGSRSDVRLAGLCFVAHMTAWELGIDRTDVPPSTLKKATTGNGRADKKAMLAAVRSWGYDPKDDNEADAIALLHYVEAQRAAA